MKLIEFLSGEKLNQKCPGIQAVVSEITNYFGGIKPKISDITICNPDFWDEITTDKEVDPDDLGFYDTEDKAIYLNNKNNQKNMIKYTHVAIHEMIHGILSYKDIVKLRFIEEGLTDLVTEDIMEKFGFEGSYSAYAAGIATLNNILSWLNISVREFANIYAKALRRSTDMYKWFTNFVVASWENKGSPENEDWYEFFDNMGMIDDYPGLSKVFEEW